MAKQRPTRPAPVSAPPSKALDDAIFVAPSPVHGRGVFARRGVVKGEVVHVAPLILVDDDTHDMLTGTPLDGFVYEWHDGGVAFALGYGSLFNHDLEANCTYELVDDDHPAWPAQAYVALRKIKAGEELTVDYSGAGEVELWFDP